jgi:hypothetical protein
MRSDPPGGSASGAAEREVEEYRQGACHLFAVALHRRFGWRMHVVLDAAEAFWTDEADADNFIASVVHVYAVDGRGKCWDVAGSRPFALIGDDLASWVEIGERDSDECRSEAELATYVGCWAEEGEEPIERPLWSYGDAEVEAADAVALRVLAGLPGFPAVAAPAAP